MQKTLTFKFTMEPKPLCQNSVNAEIKTTNEAPVFTEKCVDDAFQLQNILPEEMWLDIFAQVVNPNDRENYSNASLYLRSILLPKRNLFLFHNVFKIFAEWSHTRHCTLINVTAVAPSDQGRKWYSDILNLRLVCKTWNNAIQSFYRHPGAPRCVARKPGSTLESQYWESFTWSHEVFSINLGIEQPRLDTFLQHFAESHAKATNCQTKSPLLSGCVTIVYQHKYLSPDLEQREQQLFQQLKNLNYGHCIWNLKLQIHSNMPLSTKCYLKVREILELVPNLKQLQISYHFHLPQTTLNLHFTDLQLQLEALVEQHKFPYLQKLEILTCTQVPMPILNAIVRSNPHVKEIGMLGESVKFENDLRKLLQNRVATLI